MWSLLFGSSSNQKDTAQKAIVNMRSHLETLNKREAHLMKLMDEQEGLARRHVTTNKNLARAALKRKKAYETELDKIQGQIDSMNTQLATIENANLNRETMRAMSQGATALKQIHGSLNIDKVDATLDDIRDQFALSEEISETISRPLGREVDEDELNEELESLEQEALDVKMVNAGRAPVHELPTAPQTVQQTAEEEDEEEELRKLQAEMAI